MHGEHSTVRATVIEIRDHQARVSVAQGGCGRCHEEGGCGGQNLTQMFCGSPRTFWVDNPVGAVVGEQVEVGIGAGAVRKTANLAYGLPLLATIFGALAGSRFGGDLWAMAGALAGLVPAVIFVRRMSFRAIGNDTDQPHILVRSNHAQESSCR